MLESPARPTLLDDPREIARRCQTPGIAQLSARKSLPHLRLHLLVPLAIDVDVVLAHIVEQRAHLLVPPAAQQVVGACDVHLGQWLDVCRLALVEHLKRRVALPRHDEHRATVGKCLRVGADLVHLHTTEQPAAGSQLARADARVEQRVVRARVGLERQLLELRVRGEGPVEVAHHGARLDDNVHGRDRDRLPLRLARLEQVVCVIDHRSLRGELVREPIGCLDGQSVVLAHQGDCSLEGLQRLVHLQHCEDHAHLLVAVEHGARLVGELLQLEQELSVLGLLRVAHQRAQAEVDLLLQPGGQLDHRRLLRLCTLAQKGLVGHNRLDAAQLAIHVAAAAEEPQHVLVRARIGEAPLGFHQGEHLVSAVGVIALHATVDVCEVRGAERRDALLPHLLEEAVSALKIGGDDVDRHQRREKIPRRPDPPRKQHVIQRLGGRLVLRFDARRDERSVRRRVGFELGMPRNDHPHGLQRFLWAFRLPLGLDDQVEDVHVGGQLGVEHDLVERKHLLEVLVARCLHHLQPNRLDRGRRLGLRLLRDADRRRGRVIVVCRRLGRHLGERAAACGEPPTCCKAQVRSAQHARGARRRRRPLSCPPAHEEERAPRECA
mmetsp:Transcript_12172/g.32422  ORF Transcript_12172/g.32422 Transcript_12172/m.32422 type:complete len:608 (+) Transcript_12172:451-2274(+)